MIKFPGQDIWVDIPINRVSLCFGDFDEYEGEMHLVSFLRDPSDPKKGIFIKLASLIKSDVLEESDADVTMRTELLKNGFNLRNIYELYQKKLITLNQFGFLLGAIEESDFI